MVSKQKTEEGATLVEYALLVALIATLALPALTQLGATVKCAFSVAQRGIATGQARTGVPLMQELPCSGGGG